MMKRALALLAACCALAIAGCSMGEEAEVMDEGTNPLLFEITNGDGEVEGWLLGTMHALPDGTQWRTPAIEKAARDADLLMVEIATLDDAATISANFNRLAITPGLGPLSQRVTPDLRDELAIMVERSNIPAEQFHSMETWAAAVMLSQVDAPGSPRNGVDRALIAEFDGREVFGFETAAGQLGIFDALAPDDQRVLLEGSVREWTASRDDPGELTRDWLRGDEAALLEALSSDMMSDPEIRAALLVDRNKNWMGPLEDQLREDERPLVAVGAAHLVGTDGLASLLETRGFTVTRLPSGNAATP